MKPSIWRLLFTLIICLILTIIPMPNLVMEFRPPWVLLIVLYFQFFLVEYFSVFLIIALGLVLDVLLSSVLGEHVFALCLVCFLANAKARRFRLFSITQQMPLIAVFCLIYQVAIFIINSAFGYKTNMLMSLFNALLSSLLWPWVKILAEDIIYKRKNVNTASSFNH
ncbi:MAG: rod shape-determining protein MreD [Proteobacteria bacterium]|nr:rod shape-determining protein MreD [Pseudomonadota bacterium]